MGKGETRKITYNPSGDKKKKWIKKWYQWMMTPLRCHNNLLYDSVVRADKKSQIHFPG